jgi:hypothetical protein
VCSTPAPIRARKRTRGRGDVRTPQGFKIVAGGKRSAAPGQDAEMESDPERVALTIGEVMKREQSNKGIRIERPRRAVVSEKEALTRMKDFSKRKEQFLATARTGKGRILHP